MELKPLMTMHADLKEPVAVGDGPHGTRTIYDVTGGYFEGERLKGKLLASGGDWITIDADGVGHLDVRATFVTDDGANIYVQYYGALVFNEKGAAALESRTEKGADHLFPKQHCELQLLDRWITSGRVFEDSFPDAC